MATREEVLARARANIQPGIDASREQVRTLDDLVSARRAAIYSMPGVVAAWTQVETWTATFAERVNTALNAPAVQTPLATLQEAQATLLQREAKLINRLAAIKAYFDELERRAASQTVIDTPPSEVS